MARYRRRRFYKRKSGRWSPNLSKIHGNGSAPSNADFADSVTIAQNNTATGASSITQVFTVKNIEVAAQLEASPTSSGPRIENIEYYVLYIPQGYAIAYDIPETHPEWIMAYKYVGSAFDYSAVSSSNAQVPKIKTRLARKLNSGDSIIFMIRGHNYSTSTNVEYSGLVRWWTKAN